MARAIVFVVMLTIAAFSEIVTVFSHVEFSLVVRWWRRGPRGEEDLGVVGFSCVLPKYLF